MHNDHCKKDERAEGQSTFYGCRDPYFQCTSEQRSRVVPYRDIGCLVTQVQQHVNNELQHVDDHRTYRRSEHSEFGKAEFPENKQVVQNNIQQNRAYFNIHWHFGITCRVECGDKDQFHENKRHHPCQHLYIVLTQCHHFRCRTEPAIDVRCQKIPQHHDRQAQKECEPQQCRQAHGGTLHTLCAHKTRKQCGGTDMQQCQHCKDEHQ